MGHRIDPAIRLQYEARKKNEENAAINLHNLLERAHAVAVIVILNSEVVPKDSR